MFISKRNLLARIEKLEGLETQRRDKEELDRLLLKIDEYKRLYNITIESSVQLSICDGLCHYNYFKYNGEVFDYVMSTKNVNERANTILKYLENHKPLLSLLNKNDTKGSNPKNPQKKQRKASKLVKNPTRK